MESFAATPSISCRHGVDRDNFTAVTAYLASIKPKYDSRDVMPNLGCITAAVLNNTTIGRRLVSNGQKADSHLSSKARPPLFRPLVAIDTSIVGNSVH
jgi:hypothetical protein